MPPSTLIDPEHALWIACLGPNLHPPVRQTSFLKGEFRRPTNGVFTKTETPRAAALLGAQFFVVRTLSLTPGGMSTLARNN